jgi:hypothetical protein
MFGGSSNNKPTGESLENLVLEEELELQLALLKDHDATPDITLFPEGMNELPHLNDEPSHHEGIETPKLAIAGPSPLQILAIEESVLEENTLETAMFCLVMAAIILLPQFAEKF